MNMYQVCQGHDQEALQIRGDVTAKCSTESPGGKKVPNGTQDKIEAHQLVVLSVIMSWCDDCSVVENSTVLLFQNSSKSNVYSKEKLHL